MSFSRALSSTHPDIDGDYRADVCGRGHSAVLCIRSTGAAFAGAPVWWGTYVSEADLASDRVLHELSRALLRSPAAAATKAPARAACAGHARHPPGSC